ncbi:MAG TPA: 4-vinyl reductase [Smithella sp.]|nr:4-vinyl reductase [Smithella sp.]
MTDAQCIKGSNFNSILKYVKEKYGPDAPDKAIKQLLPEDQRLFENAIYDGAWLPERVYSELSCSIDKVFGNGDHALSFTIGHYNALNCVPKLYALFVRNGSPEFSLKSASNFWRQTHNSGNLVIQEVTPNSTTIYLKDFYHGSHNNPAFCHGLRGYFAGVLELSGAKNVRIFEEQCGALGASHCVFKGTWT